MRSFVAVAVLGVLSSSLGATAAPASMVAARPSPGPARPLPRRTLSPGEALSLYSPRARRLVQTYLRLRLLQDRELQLERVRAVIEHRLGIGALLGETP